MLRSYVMINTHPQYRSDAAAYNNSRIINKTRRNKSCATPLTIYEIYVDEKGNLPHTHLNHKPRALTTAYTDLLYYYTILAFAIPYTYNRIMVCFEQPHTNA